MAELENQIRKMGIGLQLAEKIKEYDL